MVTVRSPVPAGDNHDGSDNTDCNNGDDADISDGDDDNGDGDDDDNNDGDGGGVGGDDDTIDDDGSADDSLLCEQSWQSTDTGRSWTTYSRVRLAMRAGGKAGGRPDSTADAA